MSLLTDQDYFLQSLRLAFLRLDAPVSAHSTSHLVQPTPTYALSQHALYAGLTGEHVPEFGLARSPGPVPSSTTAAAAGRRSPYSKDRSLDKASSSSRSRGNNGPPLPFPAIDTSTTGTETAANTGSSALKHSTTIVGRHGEKGGGSGASAGIRVKGRKTNWRPKPHQLAGDYQLHQQQQSEPGSALSTPRPDDGNSTFQDGMHHEDLDDHHLFLDDNTPQPSRRPSRDDKMAKHHHDGDSESDEYDRNEEDDSTDEEADNASSDTDDGAIGQNADLPPPVMASNVTSGRRYGQDTGSNASNDRNSMSKRPYSDRALSEAIANSNMQRSPSGSYGDSASASVSASQADGSLMGDNGSASLTGSSAAQMSHLSAPGGRPRQGTLDTADTLSMNTSPSVDDRLIGVDSDEEEDDFEFSLPGNDGSSPTIFLNSQPGSGIITPIGGVTTFVSPQNGAGNLPSIAEAAEMNEQLSGNGLELGEPSQNSEAALEAGQLSEEAALKAAQSARRRARRRVNISGRMPLKLNIPPSPELPPGMALSPTSPRLRLSSAGTGSSRPQSPVTALSGAKDGRFGSPAPVYSHSPLSRTKSGRIIGRQRAQTDPAPLSASNTPLPSPGLPRTRSSDNQHPLRTATPPLGTATPGTQAPNSNRAKSLTSSPVTKARETPPLDFLPTPPKGLPPRRAKSTGPGETASPLKLHHNAADATALAKSASAAPNVEVVPGFVRPSPHKSHSRSHNHDPYVSFPIRKIPVQLTPPPAHSALSVMLRKEDTSASSASNNPFNELYGALFAPEKAPASRRRFGPAKDDDSGSFVVTMYYPFSNEPAKPIKMTLKPDLIVEEVIGCALWKYWEAERKPSLLPDSQGNNDDKWDEKGEDLQAKLKACQYILRIADEDEDGEVDDDFPAPERTRPAKGFGTCFAIVPASPTQAKQYQQSDMQIQRRPSRIIKRISRPTVSPQPSASNLAPVGNGNLMLPAATSHILPTGGGGMSSATSYISASFAGTPTKASFNAAGSASLVLVRIRIPLRGLEDVTTAVKVPLDMYLADVLETLCKKRNLGNPRDWVLVVPDRGIIVPLDRTVESLQGAYQLALQKKSTMPHAANAGTGTAAKAGIVNTNPNASIFKRLSEPPQPRYVTSADLNTNYRSYVVQRKMPMPLGRHERVLSLDNDYIHIMPSDTKLASGTVRTASYHISQVASCKASKRAPSSFKLVVWRNKDRDVKRYDFEAANGRMATEIVQTIQALMHAYKEGLEQEQINAAANM